jgi:hypothetical protein
MSHYNDEALINNKTFCNSTIFKSKLDLQFFDVMIIKNNDNKYIIYAIDE